jgi:hypothetical protein
MRKVSLFLLAFTILLGVTTVASAHGRGHGRKAKHNRVLFVETPVPLQRVRVVTVRRPVSRVLGVRYYQRDNYGRRRSALAHRQNAERRALHLRQMQERRLARRSGLNRRALAHQQRAERRLLRRHFRRERGIIH